jgi:anti-sigma factor RsiW
MNCHAIHHRLVAFQDEELAPGEHALVTAHLASCLTCRARARRLARTTPEPFLQIPHQLEQASWARLNAAIEAAAAEDVPVGRPSRQGGGTSPAWWSHRASVPVVALVGSGLLFLLTAAWGVGNWLALRGQGVVPDRAPHPARHSGAAPSPPIPAHQFRPSAVAPATPVEPSLPVGR